MTWRAIREFAFEAEGAAIGDVDADKPTKVLFGGAEVHDGVAGRAACHLPVAFSAR